MKPFLTVLAFLISRLRGVPPPISEADVRRAQRDIETATAAERVSAAAAARRAVTDFARGPLVPSAVGDMASVCQLESAVPHVQHDQIRRIILPYLVHAWSAA